MLEATSMVYNDLVIYLDDSSYRNAVNINQYMEYIAVSLK